MRHAEPLRYHSLSGKLTNGQYRFDRDLFSTAKGSLKGYTQK